MSEFFQRLKQRMLVQWGVAYVAAAFAFLQGIDVVAQQFAWPDGVRRGITVALIVGLFVTLVLAWYHGERGAQRVSGAELLILALLLAIGGAFLWRFAGASHDEVVVRSVPSSTVSPRLAAAPAIPDKSIAVLPFENLSDDKANTYFADGTQVEILRDLVKIADLKVTGLDSVAKYRNVASLDLKEIANTLRIRYVLEGSVQRAGERIRVQAQLIDTTDSRNIWAEKYDRQLADVFAIQSEIAENIASQLQVRITPEEKTAIEILPTKNIPAYASYVKANKIVDRVIYDSNRIEDLWEAERLLTHATQLDPTFFLAYCKLAFVDDQLYFNSLDHTPFRLALAEAALETARGLHPDAGEVHLAAAAHYYFGYLDYEHARQELVAARKQLPNDPYPLLLLGYIDRRQGLWDKSIQRLEDALDLDPRNLSILKQLALTDMILRRYADVMKILDRAIALAPDDPNFPVQRAAIEMDWHADTKPLHAAIDQVLAQDPRKASAIADLWIDLALCERDTTAAEKALAVMSESGCQQEDQPYPRSWCEGLVAREKGDTVTAQSAFKKARSHVDSLVKMQPDFAGGVSVLGMIDAALGDKTSAIAEGRKAVALLPVSEDAIRGPLLLQNLAIIYAWTGEKDAAFEILKQLVAMPGYLSYGQLKLHPYWSPLRSDPRFASVADRLITASD